ncbi:MAG: hypothetical protein CMJ86_01950, partial [Planctomycetes bacterium]|nr:hypothetical protein [Planctomycetota bacterium]
MQEPYIREGFGTSAYHGLTLIHPIGLAAVVVAAVWLLLSHKSQAWLPVLLVACFVPTSQRVVVATLDFNLIRILLAVATFRILQRQEYRGLRFTHLDQAFLAWVLLSALIHVLRLGTVPGMISKLGSSYDALGLYAVARCWFRNIQDLMRLSRAAAIIACISVVGFAVERTTGKNMYAVFGGVPEITTVREGRLRCQGPFAHAILAGTFWVAFLPLVFARALSARGRKTLVAGVVSIIVIVVLCSSSTPLLGVIASAGFGVLWF